MIMVKWFSLPRLETRTKESNIYASKRVANPNAKLKLKRCDPQGKMTTVHDTSVERSECKHTFWYLKDGEICLNRVNPGGTLVEARSDSDVLIYCQTWV